MEQNFENIILPEEHKEELLSVGEEAREKHVDYVGQGIVRERKDIFKEVLGDRASSVENKQEFAQAPLATNSDDEFDRIKTLEKSKQLQELVNFAATKGPVEASLIVAKIGDPWLEDQFHDVLIKFHDELIRRNVLKED